MSDLNKLREVEISFGVAPWEANLYRFVKTRYTPGNPNVSRFNSIENAVYESVLQLRQAACANSGNADVDAQGFPKNLKSPISLMLHNILGLTSYLSQIFAFEHPPFRVSEDPAAPFVTTAITEKLRRDAFHGRWALQLMKAATSAVMFDYSPMIQWADTGTNRIHMRALDPYNTVIDEGVPKEDLGERGSFAYTTEMWSMSTLYATLVALGDNATNAGKKLVTDAIRIQTLSDDFLSMGIGYVTGSGIFDRVVGAGLGAGGAGGATDWSSFGTEFEFSKSASSRNGSASNNAVLFRDGNSLAVSTYWIKALPEWLGLPPTKYGTAASYGLGVVPVWKVYTLGALVLGVKRESSMANRLNIACGAVRINSGNMQQVTFADILHPFQVADSRYEITRAEVIRRQLGRSGIYNSQYVDPDTLDNKHVRLKTGQTPEGNPVDVRSVYLRDTIDGNSLAALIGGRSDISTLAAALVGNNPQMQGMRTPGNKLSGEVQMETTYAESSYRVYAMVFQETLIGPMREMLKHNLELTLADLSYVHKLDGKRKLVSSLEFKESAFTFEISDGSSPASNAMSADAVNTLLANLAQMPQLQGMFDLRTLFTLLAKKLGLNNVDSIPTPSQSQQILMQTLNSPGVSGGGAATPQTSATQAHATDPAAQAAMPAADPAADALQAQQQQALPNQAMPQVTRGA